eukprot:g4267.t1
MQPTSRSTRGLPGGFYVRKEQRDILEQIHRNKVMMSLRNPKSANEKKKQKMHKDDGSHDEKNGDTSSVGGNNNNNNKDIQTRISRTDADTTSNMNIEWNSAEHFRLEHVVEVKDPDGTWRKGVHIYVDSRSAFSSSEILPGVDDGEISPQTSRRRRVVLHFGNDEYEGLDDDRTYTMNEATQDIFDPDNDRIETRAWTKPPSLPPQRKRIKRSRQRKRSSVSAKERRCPEINPWERILNRIRGQLGRIRFNELFVQSYENDGWRGRGGSANASERRKLRPEQEIRRARRACIKSKLRIRDIIKDLRQHPNENEVRLPASAYDGSFVLAESVFCAVCRSADCEESGNDILLCDHAGCDKAFHQKCLNPIVVDVGGEDDPWYCHRCQCFIDALILVNDHFGTNYDEWTDVFQEEVRMAERYLMNSPRKSAGGGGGILGQDGTKKPTVVRCDHGHKMTLYRACDDDVVCDKCESNLDEDDVFYMCTRCSLERCEDCALGRVRRLSASGASGDSPRKRRACRPRRAAALNAMRAIAVKCEVENAMRTSSTQGEVERGATDGGTETVEKSTTTIKQEEGEDEEDDDDWGSDSDPEDFHAESEDSDEGSEDSEEGGDDADSSVAASRAETNRESTTSLRRGRRKRKKVDYVALAGEISSDALWIADDDDVEFDENCELTETEIRGGCVYRAGGGTRDDTDLARGREVRDLECAIRASLEGASG